MLFCNVPFLQWLQTSFPSPFPSELSSSHDAFNRPPPPPPVYILQTNPGALNTQRRELYIQLSIYISVYNPMASSSCPYLANLDNLAIPVASLVMLISFTCSYLPILIITRRACVIFMMYNVLNSPVILSWHRKQKYIFQPTHNLNPPSLS